jgi:hypothetical protein
VWLPDTDWNRPDFDWKDRGAVSKSGFALERLENEALAGKIITIDELKRWQKYLEKAASEGTFFRVLVV